MTATKIGRNDPCPCGSGKKYKQCCGKHAEAAATAPTGKQTAHNADTLNNHGVVELERGNPAEAERYFREALAVDPNHALAIGNLGTTLSALGHYADAIACYERAIALKPDYVDARANLGQLVLSRFHYDAAIHFCERALAIDPDHVNALNNVGAAYYHKKKMDDALTAWRKAQRLAPRNGMIATNMGLLLKDIGRLDEACKWLGKALDLATQQKDVVFTNLFFAMQFNPHTRKEDLHALYARHQAEFEAPLADRRRPHPNERDPARRLRIAYLSADFHRHAISYFIEPILEQHDRTQFDVYCYYNGIGEDDVTRRLRGMATGFVNCSRLNDEQLAEVIRLHKIDILVDLGGHTAQNRLTMFAHKPAPVQITYLGYPGSSWLSTMDYLLTDRHSDPDGSEDWYSEKLLHLPTSHFCYRPAADAAEIDALPARKNGYVTFGSFSNINKIDDTSIALWADILKRVAGSRLLMRPVPEGKERERVSGLFAAHGVTADRLMLQPPLPVGQFMRAMAEADIALDPVAVNSPTTMCETLWMGLPTISLAGARAPSRTGRSILAAAGLLQYGADTPDAYVDIACHLASDIDALARLRADQRTLIANSALRDEAGFTRQLEDSYRQVWGAWCANAT
jgi:predicted O-linked N-acetylglucosamine transferase (SPINDLY family)